ncbi:hypothetical protein ACFXKC_50455 [Streptomyces sp. NPDC059340]|uniref:hypothetical protein n=1 Tax=Streptomyces sp. NPDC059340 TaxID=3346806 RepID=UPI0036757639
MSSWIKRPARPVHRWKYWKASPRTPHDHPASPAPSSPPRHGPPATTPRPRPRTRRGLRRRPTPILTQDPATTLTAVVDHVRRLCEMVLRSNDIDSLADFAAHYDPRGARTFACLLYTLDRRESAPYW